MRVRLSSLLLLLMTVVLVSLGVPLAVSLAASEARTVEADRHADLALFASLVPEAGERDGAARVGTQALAADLRRYDGLYGIQVAVVDAAGAPVVWSSEDLRARLRRDEPLTQRAVRAALAGRPSEGPDQLWPWDDAPLVAAQPVVRNGDVVGAVVSLSPTGDARSRVLNGWLTLAALETVALIGGALLAGRLAAWLLRPIARLDAEAHRISDGDLGARVPAGSGPPELRRLGRSFNDMASHVQASLEAQRAFVADASHQLRNPLAALLVRLQGLVLAPPEQRGAAAESAAADGRYLADTLDRMLELAKAEHTTAAAGPLDVAAVVDERLGSWHVVAARRSITLHREGDDTAPGWHDPGALAGAVDAVVDNALKYSPERTAVVVDVRRAGSGGPAGGPAGGVMVVVTDEGPGLAPDELSRVGDRFWRARSTSGEPGSGLGMSIATTLLERHGGGLRVEPGADGGLRVSLLVPATEPTDPG
jgi:signal transduction histidine kinase